MKNKKKISIVGGGFSGCIIAYLLSELGHKITLHEQEDCIGGIARDLGNKKEKYFNGPQYLDENIKWIKKLKKNQEFESQFEIFNYSNTIKNKKYNAHQSYTDLFESEEINNLFAHPVTSFNFEKISKKKDNNLLCTRLTVYQKNVRNYLESWCKKISREYSSLHYSCAERLNIGRICFINDLEKISNLKKNDKFADNILGIPRVAESNHKYYLLKKGNNNFFDNLKTFLDKKINLKLRSKITMQYKEGDNLKFYDEGKILDFDYLIWAANPVGFLKTLGYGLLDNPITKVKVYAFNIKLLNKSLLKNFFIQVYSSKSNVFRIFFYKIGEIYKITVETFFNRDKDFLEKNFVKKILLQFGIKFDFDGDIIEKKEVRHNLLTYRDYEKFMKFENDVKNNNLIGGAWHLKTREEKINHIMKKIMEKIK